MKKHIVTLKFFKDDANGEYGLAHAQTINNDISFNAFFTGIGIFHDVFEHWHEYKHPYFMGENAMNVGGEMAAMGAMWYYYDVVGMHGVRELSRNSVFSMAENMRHTTQNEIAEAIYSGYTNFGDTLNCAVPYQKSTHNYDLENELHTMWDRIREMKYSGKNNDDEKITSKEYKASVSLSKIQRLHRWGYHNAKRLVPDNFANSAILCDFIRFFNDFCKANDPAELSNIFTGIEFTITRKKGVIDWKAILTSGDCMIKDYVVTPKSNPNGRVLDQVFEESLDAEIY